MADQAAILDRALRHHQAGRIDAARAAYRAILAQHPDHAESLHWLGAIIADQGEPAAGAAMIEQSIALAPGQAAAHNSLGLAYRLLGRGEDAVREYQRAAALRPGSAEISNNLATALCDLGRIDEAIAQYRQAIASEPGNAAIWYNLANALAAARASADLEDCFRRALALSPDYVDALANYGRWLLTQGRWADAEAVLVPAARLDPSRAALWRNLGVAMQRQNRGDEAAACQRRALALRPNDADAWYTLGCVLQQQGRTDEAAACQRAALDADPHCGPARLSVCVAQLPMLYGTEMEVATYRARYAAALQELTNAARLPDIAASLASAIGAAQPFFLPYQGEDDRALQATYGKLACDLLARSETPVRSAPPPGHGERIRLGIVTGFFRQHTIFKLFLEGWLTHLDRRRFEVIGFHTGAETDARTVWSAAACDRFVQGLPSGAMWRQAIADTAPHVLLYPEIGMDPIAGRLAAQRLAPVQCVSWGQPVTTGMPTIDAFLSSELMEPADGAAHYTEQLIRLPNLGLCYLPDEPAPAPLLRAALGLATDVPIFWSGQALYKYLPRYDVVFARIAAALGDCQFVFVGFAGSDHVTTLFRERLTRAFATAGMDAARHCVFLPPMSPERFAAAVGAADVVLDTPGWSGGKSSLDCLAQNPAIVTWPGRFMRGRHTAGILRRIGCTETIADSLDDYVAIAVRLARDPAWRDVVRQRVARRKHLAFADLDYLRALEKWLIRAVHSA